MSDIYELRAALCGASRLGNRAYHARVHEAARPLRHARSRFDEGWFQDILNRLHAQAVDQAHMSPMDDSDIEDTGDVSMEILEDNCPVCMDRDEENPEEIKTLRCGHKFHKECVDRWFQEDGSCPMCRNREGREGF